MLQFYIIMVYVHLHVVAANYPQSKLSLPFRYHYCFSSFVYNPSFQIRVIERNCEIPHEGPFCDLMWSDPEDIETWAVSPRGAGWLFGSRVTSEVYK